MVMKCVRNNLWQLPGLRLTILVGLASLSWASCQYQAPTTMLIEVWTQPGWPPEDLSAPASFKLTPAQAYIAVAQSKRLSLKHQWFCFRDAQGYYIADGFGRRASARAALQHGIRVDGRTGNLSPP